MVLLLVAHSHACRWFFLARLRMTTLGQTSWQGRFFVHQGAEGRTICWYTRHISTSEEPNPASGKQGGKSKNQVAMWPELILIISYSTQNHSKSLIIHVQRSVPDPSLVQAPLIPAAHASLAAWRAEEGSRPEGHRPNQGFPRSRSVHLAIARKAERSIARAWQGLVKSITKRDSSKRHSPSSSSTTITTTTATATTTTTTATY